MDREARGLALERTHVHDVYNRTAHHFNNVRYKAWPKVKRFLQEQETGALVADVGCGSGKYLHINQNVFTLGSDRCDGLTGIARGQGHEVMLSDNLRLPYRDNCFDAVISIGVIHHFTTRRRRAQAIRELARVLRPGGRVMIYVWAMEQHKRRFEAQDVLVPWHFQPKEKHRKDHKKTERDLLCTSSVSEDEEPITQHKYRSHDKKTANHISHCKKAKGHRSQAISSKLQHLPLVSARCEELSKQGKKYNGFAKCQEYSVSDTDLYVPKASFERKSYLENLGSAKLAKESFLPSSALSSAKGKSADLAKPEQPTEISITKTEKNSSEKEGSQSISDSLKLRFKNLFRSSSENEANGNQSGSRSPKKSPPSFTKDTEYKKLIEYIMKEEADFFAASRPVLEHSLSVPETEDLFAVREFPQSSRPLPKQRSLDSGGEKCTDNDIFTCVSGERYFNGKVESSQLKTTKNVSSPIIQHDISTILTAKPTVCRPQFPCRHTIKNTNCMQNNSVKDLNLNGVSMNGDINKPTYQFSKKFREEKFSIGDEESSDGSLGIESHLVDELETSPEDEVFQEGSIEQAVNGSLQEKQSENLMNCASNFPLSSQNISIRSKRNSKKSHTEPGKVSVKKKMSQSSLLSDDWDISPPGGSDISPPRGSDDSSPPEGSDSSPQVDGYSDEENWARTTAEVIEVMQNKVMKNTGIGLKDPVFCKTQSNRKSGKAPSGVLIHNGNRLCEDTQGGSNDSDSYDVAMRRAHMRGSETWSISSDGNSESVSDFDDGEALNHIEQGQEVTGKVEHKPEDQPLNQYDQGQKNTMPLNRAENISPEEATYHRYYHVFKQGELVGLIEKYVDGLHILKSYYDHANWCVVAEKVQVWTI